MTNQRVARGRLRPPRSDGAAAVEFALVSTLFFLILFGIIQYGLFFNDSLNTRQGVRETARQGVVRNFPSCAGASTDMEKLKCSAKNQIAALAGTSNTYVKVIPPSPSWAKTKPLVVCALVKTDAVGFLPMPNNGWVSSRTEMSIEQDAAPLPTGMGSASADTLPAGPSWSGWC